MFGSEVLEVAIGVVFVYLLLSLICSAISELMSRAFAMRSSNLEDAIRNLLADPSRAEALYNHPLISGLAKRGKFDLRVRRAGKPSYIPSRAFALALFDVVTDESAQAQTLEQVRASVATLPRDLQRPLLNLIDAADGTLAGARKNVEAWFDDAMERASGWYKRKIELVVLGLAVGISILLNADTFTIVNALTQDGRLRAAVVAAAEQAVRDKVAQGPEVTVQEVQKYQEQLYSLRLPFGWVANPDGKSRDPRRMPWTEVDWASKFLGLLFTTMALSLGAPFWFDMLNKLAGLRSTGKAPEKAGDGVSGVLDYPAASGSASQP